MKAVSSWTYPPFSGSEVEIDYPIVFTDDPSTRDALESQLNTKLTGLSPTEPPEFATRQRRRHPPRRKQRAHPRPRRLRRRPRRPSRLRPYLRPPPRRHHVATSPKPPTLTLQQRVLQVLSSNPRPGE